MDLNAIRARVRKLTGVRMEQLLSPSELDQIINEAYLHVCALGDWSFLYADGTVDTASGTKTYQLPSAVEAVRSVAITSSGDEKRLWRRTLEDFDRYPQWEAEVTSGVPWAWAVRTDTSFDVFPTPDGAYTLTVRGWADVSPLSADTDEPLFDDEFHPVVSLDAAARVLAEEGDDSGRDSRYRREVLSYLLRMGRKYDLPQQAEAARSYAAAGGEQLPGEQPPPEAPASPGG